MRKEEFFDRLEYLLQDMTDKDKKEAMQYYRDYVEEAGPEKEEEVIAEFGSPERVAAIIRADIMGNLEDGGSFTETGYEDERFRDPGYQVARRYDLPEEQETETAGNQKGNRRRETGRYCRGKDEKQITQPLRWLLIGILVVIASPFLLGAGGTILGILVGFLSLLFGGIVTVLLLTAAAFIAGVVLAAFGAVFMMGSPLEGLLLLGLSLISLGCGVLGLVVTVALIGMLLPFLWRCLMKAADSLMGRRKEGKRHE